MAIYIALGANLPSTAGPPARTLVAALGRLAALGIAVTRRSRLYRSPAWPRPEEPEFVNAAAEIATKLPPAELMDMLLRIEAEFGRKRAAANAPRSLDIDLLDYDGLVAAGSPGPVLPHPRLAERAFVLRPLAEIAPSWRHPASGRTIGELIAALGENATAEPLPE